MTTWWAEHNASVREHGVGTPLLDAAVALLDDVEAAFAVTGAQTPGWPAPDEDPTDEQYSQVTEPERFAIIAARAEAWSRVLVGRGWVQARTHGTRRLLVPHRRGAAPLVLNIVGNHGATFLRLFVGDPPMGVAEYPDCACDACDLGSDFLLREIDQDIFSAVDGSLEIVEGVGKKSLRTSFRGTWGMAGEETVRGVAGGPWAEEWWPRRLVKPF